LFCRTDTDAAYEHFLNAASVDGPDQAAAFAFLGHFFRTVKQEEMKARKCYRRALEIDPRQASAGRSLCDLLHASNSENLVGGVCEEILSGAATAEWARRRLGVHHLWLGRPREAITALQAALRMAGDEAETWEALGAAYENIGRLVAALKAYERSVELDPGRVYSLTQGAAISALMGDTGRALQLLEMAATHSPNHPAVLLTTCQTRCQLAARYVTLGAHTAAAESLELAAAAVAAVTGRHGTLEAAWKLRGDCHLRLAHLPSASQPPLATIAATPLGSAAAAASANSLVSAFGERCAAARAAQRSYAAAVHLNPRRPASWSDLALTQHTLVTLCAAHASLHDGSHAAHLSRLSERIMAAAIALAPDVPGFWSALGSIATGAARREYALRRAIELEPGGALTWLKLARLYHEHHLPEQVPVRPSGTLIILQLRQVCNAVLLLSLCAEATLARSLPCCTACKDVAGSRTKGATNCLHAGMP
jgi:superkiller protein 3